MVIGCLFDDATRSYYRAIREIMYHGPLSVGINEGLYELDYYKIDLSINNNELISSLSKLPKPDVILASPPCEAGSCADCGGRMVREIGSTGRICNRDYYNEYNKTAHKVKRRSFIQKEITRINGELTASGLMMIIEHFKPNYWLIENPATSKIWEFYKNHGNKEMILNKTYYSSYNRFFSKKPTIFGGNVKLNLLTNDVKGNSNHMNGSYSQRSDIPKELIGDIISQLK